jgi:hypothetical protein
MDIIDTILGTRKQRRLIMAEWSMSGTYFKSCNCDPGCPCDFMSEPTHHECTGVIGMKVDHGQFDGVSLDGAK